MSFRDLLELQLGPSGTSLLRAAVPTHLGPTTYEKGNKMPKPEPDKLWEGQVNVDPKPVPSPLSLPWDCVAGT